MQAHISRLQVHQVHTLFKANVLRVSLRADLREAPRQCIVLTMMQPPHADEIQNKNNVVLHKKLGTETLYIIISNTFS